MVLSNEIQAIIEMCCLLLQVKAAVPNVPVMCVLLMTPLIRDKRKCFLTFDL